MQMVLSMNETDLPSALHTAGATGTKRKRNKKTKNIYKRGEIWYFVRMVKGERKPVSLETSDKDLAIAKRDALMAASGQGEIDRVLNRTHKNTASLEEIETAYLAADWPRQKSRENNLRALWLVVRRGLGREIAGLDASALTGSLVEKYQDEVVARARARAKEEKLGEAETQHLVDQAKYSANRVLAQGRSVFANEKPFRALHLPDCIDEFRARDPFQIVRDLAFKPMSKTEMDLFGAKSKVLRTVGLAGNAEALGAYATWLVMRWLGLRNEEAEFCKPDEWIVEKEVQDRRTGDRKKIHVLRITNYPYFKVKGVGSIRDLPLSDWLLEELRLVSKGREWLVSDANLTARRNITHRSLNDWMAVVYTEAIKEKILPKGCEIRTAYDFRKQAGSELLAQGASIVDVSKWLGHRDVNTTTKWYVNLLRELPVLADLSVG